MRLQNFLEAYYGTKNVDYKTKGVNYKTKGVNYKTKDVDYETFSDTEYGQASKGKSKEAIAKAKKKKQHADHNVPEVPRTASQKQKPHKQQNIAE
jgi:hypothetical protein